MHSDSSVDLRVGRIWSGGSDITGRWTALRVGYRFLVSKPVTPNPNQSFILTGEVLRFSDQIRRDPAVTRRNLGQISTNPARFLFDLDGSGHISTRYRKIHSDFVGSGQISVRSWRIQPDFVSGNKPETDPNQPETDETQTEKSNQISGSVSGQFFIHLPHSGRVRVGHKPDPTRPVDTPTRKYIKSYQFTISFYNLLFYFFYILKS